MTTQQNATPDLSARIAQLVAEINADTHYRNRVLHCLDVLPCPRCRAWPRMMCTSSSGIQAWSYHAARRKAWDTLNDAQRIEAYARHQAEQEWRRAECDKYLADPAVQARIAEGRAATAQAWAQIVRSTR